MKKSITTRQAKVFLSIANYARTHRNDGKKSFGVTKTAFFDLGGDLDTFTWAIKNHYMAYHEGRDLWFAFVNPKHPDCTIEKLEQKVQKADLSTESVLL